jgi:hypothetical protein
MFVAILIVHEVFGVMPLFSESIDTITEADLQALVLDEDSEAKLIEYKELLPTDSSSGKKEFLADAASFANALGGDLVYGMRAKHGVPTEVAGLELSDPDGAILRLENMLRDGIRPRIAVRTKLIRLADGKTAILIRILKGLAPPHQIVFDKDYRFYTRSSVGKYRLDVDELRTLFELSGTMLERIRNFRVERISAIVTDDTPIPLNTELPRTVLHLVPLNAFAPGVRHDLSALIADESNKLLLRPLGGGGWDANYTLEGLLTYNRFENDFAQFTSYLHFYRNGIIEIVDAFQWRYVAQASLVDTVGFEKVILDALPRLLEAEKILDIEPPLVLMYSLLGVKGYRMERAHPITPINIPREGGRITRENLLLPEVTIETYDVAPHQLMRPVFDAVWNAAGWSCSKNYDEAGNWRGRT